MRLFVYGTLMSGEASHGLLEGARFVGDALTVPAFELVSCGWYPALVAGGATTVAGEVWEVDDARVPELDAYEGAPGLYSRVAIELKEGGKAVAYVMDAGRAEGLPRLAGGSWRER